MKKKTEMERGVEVKKWREGSPLVEFTLKKVKKSILELDDKSRKKYSPTRIDYFDSARTPGERDIFSEWITRENKIVVRMMGARKKAEKLRKKNKSLLPHVKRGEKILSSVKEGGRVRSAYYKELYELYRIEAERLRNKGHSKRKSEITKHIVSNTLSPEIKDFFNDHPTIKPLSRERISRII